MYRYSVIREQSKPREITLYDILALFGLLTCMWLVVEVALIFTPYASIFKF